MSISEPLLLLYTSSTCRHCANLYNIWPKVIQELKQIHPELRFFEIKAKDNQGVFDENTAPRDIYLRYAKWFPMILLIPGKLWDEAMKNLGPKNSIEIVQGVQIFNGAISNGFLKYEGKYDMKNPKDFGLWLKDSLNNEEFKKAQNAIAPLIQTKSLNGINSFISNIPQIPREIEKEYQSDICSIRLISRKCLC